MSPGKTTSSSSRKPVSRKPTEDTVKLCYCDPETLVDLGEGHNRCGRIYFCPAHKMIDTILWDEFVSFTPLTFKRPLV